MQFLKSTILTISFITAGIFMQPCFGQNKIYVSNSGSDENDGTFKYPVQHLATALSKASGYVNNNVVVILRGGVYPQQKTMELNQGNFKERSLTITSYPKEKATITGSAKVNPVWQPYKENIIKAKVAIDFAPDQLFINGKSLPMARYPNFDSTVRVYNGTAKDAISESRVKTWQAPAGGYIHALHSGEWGSFDYLITGKDDKGILTYEGGWQNNRPSAMNKQYRFVENIFEELDAPGEWFYNKTTQTLYLYPPTVTDLKKAVFTMSGLTDLIHISGSKEKPLSNITIKGINFTQTARSFMLAKEPLLRSDWRMYRGGAILLDRTEHITISNCSFYELGGNAVFVSNYSKNDTIRENYIHTIGGNAIAFVGSPNAARSPAFSYETFVPWDKMDYQPGPKNSDYPQYCVATGNLIHHIGTIEKQVAGVQVSMSSHITISHNTIYHTPRAGLNMSEGTWGGHIIEFNDVFNTVLETGDNGAYNSWGRDRYWLPERNVIDSIVAARPGIQFLDVIDPITIRNNRFQCDHGWDIDLDDGSSNYLIYNNVCLSGGLKLREGYSRTVTNNIIINNTFHPHVWLKNSNDIFEHNIVSLPYAPILMNNWGKNIDHNYFLTKDALAAAQSLGLDKNSNYGDAQFIDAKGGDYHLKPGSPALKSGFKDFDMHFGVTSIVLKKLAQKPAINPLVTSTNQGKQNQVEWLGARFKNIESLGERSAAGLHDDNGALLTDIPPSSLAAKNGLEKGDVVIKINEDSVNSVEELLRIYQKIKWMGKAELIIMHNQVPKTIHVNFNK
ncbi:right-handed parallel beta-helix repeat-containing protein [Mucilaginibacter sp. 22184]|uniref:right-handed parallel beta-helix repeat-containing protein n=1 Tax=Mucilaginibacter sp. 22184 TaxID=3453887 RepID=UPI003F845CB1